MSIPEQVHALIIEDDTPSVAVITNLFKQMGISYTTLFEPTKAVEIALSLPRLDIILVDLEMPICDGYQVLQNLRDQEPLANIPVVAYTSHLSEMAQAREKGFHSFFGKPIRSTTFREDIGAVLNGTPVWVKR
jgi:two-component system, cell cycle response regulator DivK